MSLELDVRKDTTGNISTIRYSDRFRLVERSVSGVDMLVVIGPNAVESPVCEKANIVHLVNALQAALKLWPAR